MGQIQTDECSKCWPTARPVPCPTNARWLLDRREGQRGYRLPVAEIFAVLTTAPLVPISALTNSLAS
jgi:hypothetical protein